MMWVESGFISQAVSSGMGAFVGAVVAFLLGFVGLRFARLFDKRLKNRNALVQLERLLHKYDDTSWLVGQRTRGLLTTIKESKTKGVAVQTALEIPTWEIVDGILFHLVDLEIVNEAVGLNSDLYIFNHDIMELNSLYKLIRDDYKRNKNVSAYILNTQDLMKNLLPIQKGLEGVNTMTIQLLAKIQILLRKVSTPSCFERCFMVQEPLTKKERAEIPKEIKKIKSESGPNKKLKGA